MATPRSRATGTGVTKLPPSDNGGVGETLGNKDKRNGGESPQILEI